MYDGQFAEAARSFERALCDRGFRGNSAGKASGIDRTRRDRVPAPGGDRQLRRLPWPVELHLSDRSPRPSTPAVGFTRGHRSFNKYLDERPRDLRVRWLLNIAQMTLGEYPSKVPPEYLIPLDRFRSKIEVEPIHATLRRWLD